jgi:hypothetical protein
MWFTEIRGGIYAAFTQPLPFQVFLEWLGSLCMLFCPRPMPAGFLSSQHRLDSAYLLWVDGIPVPLLHWTLLACFITRTEHIMTRPRGRPRRGSPWKPRRPSVTPPGSPSVCSSPRPQSESIAALPQDPQGAMVISMATIPRSPISLSHHLHDPLVNFHPPAPILGSSGDPPPHGAPKRAEPHSTGSFDRMHFRDRLLIMHDLVFELRQEVADLNYRLQATDEKVASCLQLLSSMQAALTSDPVEAMPREAPAAATDEGPNKAQRPVNRNRRRLSMEAMMKELRAARQRKNFGQTSQRTLKKSLGQGTSLPCGQAYCQVFRSFVCFFLVLLVSLS